MESIQCHYEILSVDLDADETKIKKSYRKLALKWHPDKKVNCTTEEKEEACKKFRLIQAAYDCLSDPIERRWYDEHREMILRGGIDNNDMDDKDKGVCSYIFDVIPYQHSSCYGGFDDGEKGFFTVYSEVFLQIYQGEEKGWRETIALYKSDSTNKMPYEYIEFGSDKTEWKDVSLFYTHWENFASCLNYAWEDKYDTRDADNRRVKRAMEEENKKSRKVAKKIRLEDVLSLVKFVKRRDPRVQAHKEKLHMEKLKKEHVKRKEMAQKKKDALKARASWKVEVQTLMTQRADDDLKAGRFRLDDLDDDDEHFTSRRGRGKKKNKGRMVYASSSSSEEEEAENSEQVNQNTNKDIKSIWHCDCCNIQTFPNEDEFNIHVLSNDHLSNWNTLHPSDTNTYNMNINDIEQILRNDISLQDDGSLDETNEEEDDIDSEYETEEEEEVVWKCECCKKEFKSEPQLKNHDKSKKHKLIWNKLTTAQREEHDLKAGRSKLDYDDGDEYFTSPKKRGKGKKKIKVKKLYSSEDEEEDGDGHQNEPENHPTDNTNNVDEIEPNNNILQDDPNLEETNEGKDDSDSESETEEEVVEAWNCEYCKKDFKSEPQLENHNKSKKHKQAWKKFLKRNE